MGSKRSEELYERAKQLLPGGVSSPVRAFQPYPRYIAKGKGSRLYDVDGNEYIDYCMAFGPLILGHAHPEVVKAVREQAENGTLYGAPIEAEVKFAETISRLYPSVEMMRFVSSGTEATMHGIRLARGYTGRKKIIKVEGAFHGAHDAVLVKAGSGATTHSAPNSLGIPEEVTHNTVLVPYNDPAAVEKAIRDNKGEIAAMILEPVIGNAGPILPREGYLQELREITRRNDVLLIFDEVITGFRLSIGGAQQYFKVVPDMTIMGKIAGGGLPIGIFGASKEMMSMISPVGKVYQAGTFSGNPLSLAAGQMTIKELERLGHEDLSRKGELMRAGLRQVFDDAKVPAQVQGLGSMFQVFLSDKPVLDYQGALQADGKKFMELFNSLLEQGVYLPPSQYETNFLSTAHTEKDVERTVDAFAQAVAEVFE